MYVWFPNTKLYLYASTSMAFWEQTLYSYLYINCCTSLSLLLVLPLSWFPYLLYVFTYLVLIYVASVYATDAGLGILMSKSAYVRGYLDQY